MANSQQNVTVAITDTHKNRLPEVQRNLETAGLQVKQVLEHLGVITGSITAEKMPQLSHVEGVLQVSPEREIHLAPPGSNIQ